VVAWIGPGEHGFAAWCEACQESQHLAAPPGPGTRCRRCGAALPASPRFIELWGELQNLSAVLAAWAGEPRELVAILPERPRFLTDLTPPEVHPGDSQPLATLLAAVAHGEWRTALVMPADPDPRALAARAIAHERVGDPPAAIAEWSRLLARGGDERARLARGSLWARAGELANAGRDLAFAGDSFAARWNRAALLVHEAAGGGDGIDRERLARARAAAGPASAYWSDPTVGRLLWTLLVERAAAEPRENAVARLRAAEAEIEHDTFWDLALVLAGWARLGRPADAARIAQPLARQELTGLRQEPALQGLPLREVADATDAAKAAVERGEPQAARGAIAPALARGDLRRFRVPCAACGRGTVGVDETVERD